MTPTLEIPAFEEESLRVRGRRGLFLGQMRNKTKLSEIPES